MRRERQGFPASSAAAGAVLVGNGLNRLSKGLSWDELLHRLARSAGLLDGGYELDLGKPFPLLYEEMVLASPKSRGVERLFRDEVRLFSDQLQPNALHIKILTSSIRHVLTTNYDLTLERALQPGIETIYNEGVIAEQRYSRFRHHTLQDRTFWHIHGDVVYPSSIMLGYDHYAGALQGIRQYAASGSPNSIFSGRSLIARLSRKMSIKSWVDLFFVTDVHILGLDLEFVEMHLWWVLTYRARKIADGKTINGKVRYYVPRHRGIQPTAESGRKHQLLRALRVEVVEIPVEPQDWDFFYREAIAKIAEEANRRAR